jgi:hypothetical protein
MSWKNELQKLGYEMAPNPSKVRAVHGGENPSFLK